MDRSGARIAIDEHGNVRLSIGLTEYGTGAKSGLAQILAEALGVAMSSIVIEPVDTATSVDSGGTFASRAIVMGGNAVRKAAAILRDRLCEVAAEPLGCRPNQVEFRDGVATSRTSTRRIPLSSLVKRSARKGVELTQTVDFKASDVSFDENTGQGIPYLQYTFGAVVAEVEVDSHLGAVKPLKLTTAYDVGQAINPALVEGQIEGGAGQALGYALMEELVHENGEVLNPNLRDYYLPSSLDVPEIESFIVQRPGTLGPYGAKSIGEPPIDAPAAALANAVRTPSVSELPHFQLPPRRY